MSEARIVVFDVETTGTDARTDQVIELCMQDGLDAKDSNQRTWRLRPSVEIHPEAQRVHGISMEDLEHCPSFSDVAEEIRQAFLAADFLVGYNLRFDINMVEAEFRRAKLAPLNLASKRILDPFRLWQHCEPRSLLHAHKRFVGDEFDQAHSATADVAATGRVLIGMIHAFSLGNDLTALADICQPDRASWIGESHHLRWHNGQAVMGFGKHANIALTELAQGATRDYLQWLVSADFPEHVVEICNQALAQTKDSFCQWVESTYPAPDPTPRGDESETVHNVSTPPPPTKRAETETATTPHQYSLF